MNNIELRAWSTYDKQFIRMSINNDWGMAYEVDMPHDYGLLVQPKARIDQKLQWEQYIDRNDKHDKHIFVGDIIKIRVTRHDGYGACPNANHGNYYLYAEVANVRGELQYNKNAIDKLAAPMGKELFLQNIGFDSSLFGDRYWCSHLVKDDTGNYIIDENDKYMNYKRFYDYEIVGNIHENPKLMNIMKIMKAESRY